jgi:AraC-like DNA-binding protein
MTDQGRPVSPRWTRSEIHALSPEDATRRISEVFSPHQLEVVGPDELLDVRLRAWTSENLTIAVLQHGTEVIVRPGHLNTYYEINVPLAGTTTTRCGPEVVESNKQVGAVLTPNEESHMTWSADCRQLAVKVRRSVLERTLAAHLGQPLDEFVTFKVGFDIASGPGKNWVRAVQMLRDAVDSGASDLVLRPLEELVVAQFLTAQPNNYATRISQYAKPPRPRTIRVVLEMIEAQHANPLTVAELAAAVGVSVRALQLAFGEHLGTTPMEHLRRVRLHHARQDLLAAVPGDGQTVADIAFRNGLGHLARFAAAYRALYGELPSETIRH